MFFLSRFFGAGFLSIWYLFLISVGMALIGIWGLTGYRNKEYRFLGIGSLVLFFPYVFYPVMCLYVFGYESVFSRPFFTVPVLFLCAGLCAFLGGYSLSPSQKVMPLMIASAVLTVLHFLLLFRRFLLYFPLYLFWSVVLIMLVFQLLEQKKAA